MRYGRIIFILCIFFTSFISNSAFSQEQDVNSEAVKEIEAGSSETADLEKKKKTKNINVDMQVIWGPQYNNMLSTINLSHEQEGMASLLSSYFRRSNDFGYNKKTYDNSSFYENKIGYTGNFNTSELNKSIFEIDINNDSRGMFNNPVYSREEKDKARFSIKDIYKYSNVSELNAVLSWGDYIHRLNPIELANRERSKLNQYKLELGWDYIWSSSNRLHLNSTSSYYSYFSGVNDDYYLNAEIIDDFNLTKYIGISGGLHYNYNRDNLSPVIPVILGINIKGFEHLNFAILYRNDLVPFKPEEFYMEQKYVKPDFELPPGRVHHGEAKVDFNINASFSAKAIVIVERNSAFYNYHTVYGDILSAETIPATRCTSRLDLNLSLYEKILAVTFSYEYNYFNASKRITYQPEQRFSSSIQYNGKILNKKINVEWSNSIIGKVYTDPDANNSLPGAIIGYLGLQFMVFENSYLYFRFENLYNNRYNLREGYPEPGIIILGGLRILI